MEIIKQGKQFDPVTFKCSVCGCVFKIHENYTGRGLGEKSIGTKITDFKKYCPTTCPKCHKNQIKNLCEV